MNSLASGVVLEVEVCGCPTACMHCFANGHSYAPMPLADVASVLKKVRDACTAAGLWLAAYPLHEVLAHPQATEVLGLFRELGGERFEPMITTGVPIAIRDDWREILGAVRDLGTTTFCLTLHGVGEVHDRLVNRSGAYRESCLAIERIHAAGFKVGCNVFVARETLAQFDLLARALEDLGVEESSWSLAAYTPTVRGRRYELSRPELADLSPHAEAIQALTVTDKEFWQELESHTEAAFVRQALAGQLPAQAGVVARYLVCRPSLDLFSGIGGAYAARHGSLRTDDVAAVLRRALAEPPHSWAELYFGADAQAPIAELAARVGQPDGQKVHQSPRSMLYRWLDVARGG